MLCIYRCCLVRDNYSVVSNFLCGQTKYILLLFAYGEDDMLLRQALVFGYKHKTEFD